MSGLEDTTARIFRECEDLPRGVILRHEKLPLLDAMNALPVLDPVMDTGIPTTSDLPFDPNQLYSSADLCWIMDQMVTLEVSWYCGGSLSHSVYTSLHYHNPHHMTSALHPVIHLVFRAYVLAFCKSVDLAHREFCKGQIYEAEDVWLDHFGLPITLSDETVDILDLVDEALAWLRAYDEFDLLERLVFRKQILLSLQSARIEGMLVIPRNWFAPSMLALTAFDSRIDSRLSWHGPCPVVKSKSALESYMCLKNLSDAIASANPFFDHSDIPLTRSFLKSTLDATPDEYLDALAKDYCISLPQSLDQRTHTVKSLITGCLLATLAIPLANSSRQRRKYLSISHTWLERAASCQYLGNPSLESALLSLRLDCLLEAALCGLRTDLIPSSEQSMFWWWVSELTSARRKTHGASQAKLWAEVWFCIALAKLSNMPPGVSIPVARFNLRFKWERLPCHQYSGARPLHPRYSRWCQFHSLDRSNAKTPQYVSLALTALQKLQVNTASKTGMEGIIGPLQASTYDVKMRLARCAINETSVVS